MKIRYNLSCICTSLSAWAALPYIKYCSKFTRKNLNININRCQLSRSMFLVLLKSAGAMWICVCVSVAFMEACAVPICVRLCVSFRAYTEGCCAWRAKSKMVMSCACVCLHARSHMQSRAHRVVCVFLCGSEGGGCAERSGCISIQQWRPMRSVWEVRRREGGGGQGSPSSEQNGAMGWNKAARRGGGLIGPARPGLLDLPKRKALHQFRQEN